MHSNVWRLRWEEAFWQAGARFIAGVDEVGRGALAGPLVAAAVVLDIDCVRRRRQRAALLKNVRDSKQLTRKSRDLALPLIYECSIAVATGMVQSTEIDYLGLAAANRIAMERAIMNLFPGPEVLIIDAAVVDVDCPQVGLIGGDDLSLSVAAASIVAKVTRDRLMLALHDLDHRFGFGENCGYGTAAHLAALKRFGPSAAHRHSFRPVSECHEMQ
jgi:ribonuclease HII